MPRIAVPIVVDETLASLEDAETRTRLARVIATPEMQQALQTFGVAVGRGALESTSDAEARARFERASTRLAEVFAGSLTRVFENALSPEKRKALGDVAGEVAARATHASLRAAAEEIPVSIGPAVGRSMAAQLQSPELRRAIAETTADVTRETLLKSRDVLTEMRGQSERPDLLQRINSLLSLAWVFALVVAIGAVVLFARAITLHRRLEATREDGAAELAHRAIAAGAGKPWSSELESLLEQQLHNAGLREHRRPRPGLWARLRHQAPET